MKERFNSLFIGLNWGAIAPLLGYMLIWQLDVNLSGDITFDQFMDRNSSMDKLPKIMSISIFISNLPLFFGALRLGMDKTARGILAATMGYGLIIIIMVITHWITT